MSSDKQVRQDVVAALQWEPGIRDSDIAVAVKDGVVTLGGFVDSYAEKVRAERVVERMPGVKAIAEALQVRLPTAKARSDTAIAHDVVSAFRSHVEVPDERLHVKVENGWVTLSGEVDWYYQSHAAERAVRYLTGVRGVTNLVRVKPQTVSTFEVGRQIREALRRNAELDADRITVRAHDGTVTLEGTVRSWAERRDAEFAAWSAPGVSTVEDHIIVQA